MKNIKELHNLIIEKDYVGVKNRVIFLLDEIVASNLNCFGCVIEVHPLGFLCFKWDLPDGESVRIHLWNKVINCVQNPNWPIHDHIFSFSSAVIFGKLQNKVYTEDSTKKNAKNCSIYNVIYSDGKSSLVKSLISKKISVQDSYTINSGEFYDVAAGVFHRSVLRSDLAVTALAISKKNECSPRVLGELSEGNFVYDRNKNNKLNIGDILSGILLNIK